MFVYPFGPNAEGLISPSRADKTDSELFIEGDRKVSGFFAVTSTNDGIDCEEVREEMEARVGGVFDCYSSDRGYDDAAGALTAHVFHSLGFAVMAGLFLWS